MFQLDTITIMASLPYISGLLAPTILVERILFGVKCMSSKSNAVKESLAKPDKLEGKAATFFNATHSGNRDSN